MSPAGRSPAWCGKGAAWSGGTSLSSVTSGSTAASTQSATSSPSGALTGWYSPLPVVMMPRNSRSARPIWMARLCTVKSG